MRCGKILYRDSAISSFINCVFVCTFHQVTILRTHLHLATEHFAKLVLEIAPFWLLLLVRIQELDLS